MKLGTETGSLINAISSGHVGAPTPVVGMGATILMWSDRHAVTIIAVSASGKTVTVQQDKVERLDRNGMSESQDYAYIPNPNATKRTFRLGKKGWREIGSGGSTLALGYRNEYYDFSF